MTELAAAVPPGPAAAMTAKMVQALPLPPPQGFRPPIPPAQLPAPSASGFSRTEDMEAAKKLALEDGRRVALKKAGVELPGSDDGLLPGKPASDQEPRRRVTTNAVQIVDVELERANRGGQKKPMPLARQMTRGARDAAVRAKAVATPDDDAADGEAEAASMAASESPPRGGARVHATAQSDMLRC